MFELDKTLHCYVCQMKSNNNLSLLPSQSYFLERKKNEIIHPLLWEEGMGDCMYSISASGQLPFSLLEFILKEC